jgi:zinc protease
MRCALSIIFSFFTLLSFQAVAKTQEFTLDNGLKILVKEDHRAPVAISMIWYHVGSADEPSGMTGVSHALEHMMFKGTSKFPIGVFSKKIAAVGGQENAMTNYDYTAYYEKTAASQLPTSFELEADRMQNLLLDKGAFAKEIKVIREERRQRTDDNPQALTYERFMAAAHLSAPYQHPVVGWMSDLMHLDVNDLSAWYSSFYAPNNATLVVVGDVEAEKVRDLAQLYFGHIQRRPDYIRKQQIEPPTFGTKTIEVRAPAQVPMMLLGFNAPSVKSAKTEWEPYALQIIAGILNAGESARLPKSLVQGRRLASNTDVQYEPFSRYQTQFIITAAPAPYHKLEEVKAAILKELNQLKTVPISELELKRIKTQIIAQKTFEKDSIMGQAMELGLLESIDLGWKVADTYTDKIQAVTADQITMVAKQYFNEGSMTEARLIPEGNPAGNAHHASLSMGDKH